MGDLHAFSLLLLPHLNRFPSPHHLRSYKENYIEVTEGQGEMNIYDRGIAITKPRASPH